MKLCSYKGRTKHVNLLEKKKSSESLAGTYRLHWLPCFCAASIHFFYYGWHCSSPVPHPNSLWPDSYRSVTITYCTVLRHPLIRYNLYSQSEFWISWHHIALSSVAVYTATVLSVSVFQGQVVLYIYKYFHFQIDLFQKKECYFSINNAIWGSRGHTRIAYDANVTSIADFTGG